MYICECDVQADKDSTGEAAQEVEKKLTYYELDLGLNHVVGKLYVCMNDSMYVCF